MARNIYCLAGIISNKLWEEGIQGRKMDVGVPKGQKRKIVCPTPGQITSFPSSSSTTIIVCVRYNIYIVIQEEHKRQKRMQITYMAFKRLNSLKDYQRKSSNQMSHGHNYWAMSV